MGGENVRSKNRNGTESGGSGRDGTRAVECGRVVDDIGEAVEGAGHNIAVGNKCKTTKYGSDSEW